MSSSMIIANELSPNESQTESCPSPPSLAISEHSLVKGTPQAIRDWLIALQVDSRVSPFPLPADEKEQTTPVTCGPPPSQPLAQYDHDTASWRMCQGFLSPDILELSWETWPKAGTTVAGVFYRQPSWERRINEIGSGLWLSPTVFDANDVMRTEEGWENRKAYRESIGRKSVALAGLAEQVSISRDRTDRMWPTPRAFMHKDSETDRGKGNLGEVVGGKLNPEWVELLMGWPLGWTSTEPMSLSETWQMGTWWEQEPDIPRVTSGMPERVNRLKALGNGQVPAVAATAWHLLTEGII